MLKDYFTFSKSQSRAIIFLMGSILLVLLFYYLLPFIYKDKDSLKPDELRTLMANIRFDDKYGSAPGDGQGTYHSAPLTPFHFDPNTLDSAGFKRLGLRDKLVRTLLNYRNKGGKFYNKESLRRIYGLHEDEYKQLEPYISIASVNYGVESRRKEMISIELNSADTAQLVKLRGIGSKLSLNIIQYRKQLGGFARVEQLKEVYGISDETFQMIRPSIRINTALIKKINLNAATLNEMNQHPYLRGEISKAIADFRKKKAYHLETVGQLKEIELINEEIFRKIAPYITTQ